MGITVSYLIANRYVLGRPPCTIDNTGKTATHFGPAPSDAAFLSLTSSKATIEVVHGLMGQVVKDKLFNMSIES